ncbi:hypothetical protein R3P38DRAFT_3217424 [Favolaschia claudopus]|uniref:Uncharacterized protein n=1 Tax=Favolaschia claudopus TaxID=2862362 RepID=A0AAW0A5T1_9AGAR
MAQAQMGTTVLRRPNNEAETESSSSDAHKSRLRLSSTDIVQPAAPSQPTVESSTDVEEIFAPSVSHSTAGPIPLPPIEDDEEEFGFDMPLHPAPGKSPTPILPTTTTGLNTLTTPQLTVQAQLDDNAEIPPALIPPGSNEFVADVAAAVSSTTETSGGWERPLKDAPSTRSGRKRRVYDTSNTCKLWWRNSER